MYTEQLVGYRYAIEKIVSSELYMEDMFFFYSKPRRNIAAMFYIERVMSL